MSDLKSKVIEIIFFTDNLPSVDSTIEHEGKNYQVTIKEIIEDVEFTRINLDTNGNPRYVCGWWEFGTPDYETALRLARKFGGRKFHNKQFGGGIVFCTYDMDSIKRKIIAIRAEQKAQRTK